ncbi:MAG TPA: DUF3551 domain-containing protein [Xanthobacteraceae bacterium]|nr:DUF3551 domain-containing protein [Xanthobacteraceae bacterium]
MAAGAVAATLGFGVPGSHAGTYGDEPWCAVANEGGDGLKWDCEYETVDDCTPAIATGHRGFCAPNPYWQPPSPSPPSPPPPPSTVSQPLMLLPPSRN